MKKSKAKAKKPKNKKNIILGLGNPGHEYCETRHNAGFAVIDRIADRYNVRMKKIFFKPLLSGSVEINGKLFYLCKPLTYMNRSGEVIDYIFRKTEATEDDLILICDNMDLKPGVIRMKNGGSSAGHNGIKSVAEFIGNTDFKRLYIGVGRSSNGQSVVEHVLGKFSPGDSKDFDEAVDKAAEAVVSLSEKTVVQVMNDINRKNN